MSAEDRPLPTGFPWPNPEVPVALVPCDYGHERRGECCLQTCTPSGPLHVSFPSYADWAVKREQPAYCQASALSHICLIKHLPVHKKARDARCSLLSLITRHNSDAVHGTVKQCHLASSMSERHRATVSMIGVHCFSEIAIDEHSAWCGMVDSAS